MNDVRVEFRAPGQLDKTARSSRVRPSENSRHVLAQFAFSYVNTRICITI